MTTAPFFRSSRRVLAVQFLILAFCAWALFELALKFPYPSPLEKPFLPPKVRWPTQQVMTWVEQGQFDRDFSVYFGRDPERKIPADAKIVSPADGIFRFVDYFDNMTFVVVGLSFWDVHVVRTPVAGTVIKIESEGSYYEKLTPAKRIHEIMLMRGKAAPVQTVITLATPEGEVRIRMITSYWASRLKVWVEPGTKLAKGERIGRIVLGSTVVAEFPGKKNFEIPIGQHVLGGETAISH